MALAMKILKPIMLLAFVVPLLPSLTFAQYIRTDLVSNQPEVAPNTDAHLVNAWGLVQRANSATTFSPFWVSDNGTGFSTLYTGAGAQIMLVVSIPPAPGSPAGTLGTPTGIVGNTSLTDFTITENGKSGPAFFIFATLDGTISAWFGGAKEFGDARTLGLSLPSAPTLSSPGEARSSRPARCRPLGRRRSQTTSAVGLSFYRPVL